MRARSAPWIFCWEDSLETIKPEMLDATWQCFQ